ncbi:type IX secretion system membrane protein PorP/SprF [Dysgonomonas sp. 521]|uniref:PorP/SprF family type IX secretion system membrane protein n=1 Tax=Dysgonomonas sp. 521 TaxID=2302932 RepID=UPI0013D54F0E|nr:type IX secretion system membrane protein PorP/SprF [Dysgonomonas sp. 521]NDV95207.1 type IX secretion system membrane protein PorP/SprF [Dysgonomonas sp. 521]
MKLNYITLFLLFFIFGSGIVHAQWDSQVSQYWNMKNFYNPSFVGERNVIEASLLHRRQWVGISNAPVTSLMSLNMPVSFLGKEHGVGAIMINDKLGAFNNTSTMLQYTYKFNFKKGRYLNVGLQGGMMNIEFDASDIKVFDDTISLPASIGEKKVDMGLGISWVTPNYYIGASVSHLLEPKFDIDDEYSTSISRIYYLVGGYNIKLKNPLIELQPSVLFKSDAVAYQLDVTAKIEYKKMFNGGISWRKDDGFVFLLGVKIKNIDAGYSYDLSTSEIAKVSNGSHELFIRYSLPLEKRKERHSGKSIRIL